MYIHILIYTCMYVPKYKYIHSYTSHIPQTNTHTFLTRAHSVASIMAHAQIVVRNSTHLNPVRLVQFFVHLFFIVLWQFYCL